MSDEVKQANVENPIGNIGVTTWQVGLAAAVNETYSYANSSMFCAQIAGYYRDYALRMVLPCVRWLDGYVPSLHQSGQSGIISTHIASKLISGLTKQLAGEKLVLRLSSENNEEGMADLKFASEWTTKNQIHKAIKNAIGFSVAIGTSLLKMNKRMDQTIWWEAVRFDNCFYLADFTGEVKDAKFLIRNYTDTRNKQNTQYYLVEHRYWLEYKPKIKLRAEDGSYEVVHKKGDKVPVVEYCIHRAQAQSLTNLMAANTNRSSVKWEEVPSEIRKAIKDDYGLLRIDEPQELGFLNLGVEALLNGEGDLSVPTGTNFGESMIFGIQDDLITYEIASSYLIRDMYNGKGTVFIPKSMSLGDITGGIPSLNAEGQVDGEVTPFAPAAANSPLSGLDGNMYERMPGVNPDEQGPIVQQFELRADQWQLIKENCLKNIAVKWGMSPKILSSYLAQGAAQMTATQIDSEDDISIAFINLHRSYFTEPINRLMETTMNFYGKKANVKIGFASPSLLNKDRLLERVAKGLDVGLIDMDEAIRLMNPDLEEEKLQEKIKKAQQKQKELLMQQMMQMNAEGGFGPEEMSGDIDVEGTTEPR